jgi:hypothetical protein
MIHKIFSIYDQKARAYLPPFYMHQTEMAIRVFSDCINSDNHQFAKHPADYTLFELGTFDDEHAKLDTYEAPTLLNNGIELVRAERDNEQQILKLENTDAVLDDLELLPEEDLDDPVRLARALKEAKYK